jgi:hypothetical protein
MQIARKPGVWGLVVFGAGLLVAIGCHTTPIETSEYSAGPAPLRVRSPDADEDGSYEDALDGGRIFAMYCNYCHNFNLAERNFANSKNAATHMREKANLTGKEYAKLIVFMRRWNDIPPPNAGIDAPSPKRFFYSQPIPELRQQPVQPPPDLPAGPRPGLTAAPSPGGTGQAN